MFNPEKMFADVAWRREQDALQSYLNACLLFLRVNLSPDFYVQVVEALKKSDKLRHCVFPDKEEESRPAIDIVKAVREGRIW